jgi:DNA repair exonuclease SbcCD nuclease subunit
VGDIHLGRRPTGLTERAAGQIDALQLSPAAVWRMTVDEALRRGVDAVLLAGDIVDQRDLFYEAHGALADGVNRLVQEGIRVIGVAGNHDGIVLPRLADSVPEFQLLGRDGRWERITVRGRDGTDVDILGWSFPKESVTANPLADGPLRGNAEVPTIGLLHCDRDGAASGYAPVRAVDLENHWADGWLLGHIHKPDALAGPRPVGYLGALTALDPSDAGPRGPWLVEVVRRGRITAEQLVLAPLRFEHLALDVSDLDDAGALGRRVTDMLRELHARLADSERRPHAVGVRLRLEGRTPIRRQLQAECERVTDLVLPIDATVYFVQKIANEARPSRDLADLAAGGQDPVSLLAARLLILDCPHDDPERRTLIAAARVQLETVGRKPVYTRLPGLVLDDEAIASRLRSAALLTLDSLEAQRESGK